MITIKLSRKVYDLLYFFKHLSVSLLSFTRNVIPNVPKSLRTQMSRERIRARESQIEMTKRNLPPTAISKKQSGDNASLHDGKGCYHQNTQHQRYYCAEKPNSNGSTSLVQQIDEDFEDDEPQDGDGQNVYEKSDPSFGLNHRRRTIGHIEIKDI